MKHVWYWSYKGFKIERSERCLPWFSDHQNFQMQEKRIDTHHPIPSRGRAFIG